MGLSMRDLAVAMAMAVAVAVGVIRASLERCELLAEHTDLHRVSMITGSPDRFTDLPIEPGVEPTIQRELGAPVAVRGCPVPTSRDPGDLFEVLALLEVRALRMSGSQAIR